MCRFCINCVALPQCSSRTFSTASQPSTEDEHMLQPPQYVAQGRMLASSSDDHGMTTADGHVCK
jgi:hypothetical protein